MNVLYLPSLGSHFTIWLPCSKQEKVISATEFCSCVALSAERRGAKVARGKWIRGNLWYQTEISDVGQRYRGRDSRHQIGLEFIQIDVKRTIKAERGCDRGNDLGN